LLLSRKKKSHLTFYKADLLILQPEGKLESFLKKIHENNLQLQLVSLEKFCNNLWKNLHRLYDLFQKILEVRTLSSCFSEAMIAMIPKPGNKNRINNKENYRQNISHEHW
jgi:hypothetical protein